MKGVYACAFLANLERHFRQPLYEVFDLIAGTSTGGLIALGIAAGKSAAEMLEFYRNHGPTIFDGKSFQGRVGGSRKQFRQLKAGHCYPSAPLKNALQAVFEDRKLKDAKTLLCIPAVRVTDCKPKVFKASRQSHLTNDQEIAMVDVALATSAAPSFFPIARINDPIHPVPYVDGGLWANNPSLVAITEALTYHGPSSESEFSSISLLSVGLPSNAGFPDMCRYKPYVWPIQELLPLTMESNKHGTHYMAGFILSAFNGHYYRVEPDALSTEHNKVISLDSANEPAINTLIQLGDAKAQHLQSSPGLKRFFC